MKYTSIFGFMPYGDEWRTHRRIFQQHFSEKNLSVMRERELVLVRKCLLANLLGSPHNLHEHVRNYVGGLATSLTYGLPVQRQHDPIVHLAEETFAQSTGTLAPGKYYVNIFPILQHVPEWMPGSGFKQEAKRIKKLLDRVMEEPYQAALKMMEDTEVPSCFVSESLEKRRGSPDFDNYSQCVKEIATSVFGGTSETTFAAVMSFVLAMLLRPDVQHKAQQELDKSIGPDRLPDFSDLSELTYLSAIVKETLRLVTHTLTELE
ncbi:O-methylsterigmatocystin oxidoreductase [Leucoagaricus sp. SymC.cos]|nr:O-methylsterigmatocystin oxidoreductase [Leucoagaricus sp. SymC.cos]